MSITDYPQSLSYVDLNKPFKNSDGGNGFNLFTTVPDTSSRQNVMAGALLGDDYSWIQYGGMIFSGNDVSRRDPDDVEKFDVTKDPSNPTEAWEGDRRFANDVALNGVHNWIVAGAVAISPGGKKSWWFSGIRGKDWEEVQYSRRSTKAPAGLSRYLIESDLSNQQRPTFKNITINDLEKVPPRAGASMVFLPVGKQGMLAVLGGVNIYDPIWLTQLRFNQANITTEEYKKQEEASLKFLETINLYDVENNTWYAQKATGDIPDRPISVACVVVASAEDNSSHNIYLYGGHGGISDQDETNPSFYVLSLPSFTWIKVLDPTQGRHFTVTPRSLHQCHRIQPDQMLVLGGSPNGNGPDTTECTLYPGPSPAFIFNLNTCEVQTGWDPRVKQDYRVPPQVTKVIGGSGTGGATKTKPSGDWDEKELGKLFADTGAYKEKTTPIWSYSPVDSPTTTNPSDTTGRPSSTEAPSTGSEGNGFPSYIPPLIGTLLGLFVLITVLALILFILRRRKQKRAADASASETEGSTVRKNKQTWSWLLGVYGDDKSSRGMHQPLGTYSDDMSGTGTGTTYMYGHPSTALGDNRESVLSPISPLEERSDPVVELHGVTIHEMPDTSLPQELAGHYGLHSKASQGPVVKERKTVRYDDQQGKGDDIQESKPQGHRKMSSLDYPE
ncbi:hypothetical protein BDZ91DRAFT_830892 [Kalaharituber pfeilii]|nr:hypothetical protein BDZ91DRAFT_830892 [Kalaharituber pfeilii]